MQKQKEEWVVKNFLINSIHLYSIEKLETHTFNKSIGMAASGFLKNFFLKLLYPSI